MYIQEIILDGFKSYATQTRIGLFDPSFTAITGLNGAGKSNILDAICFVLGISSLSRIRVTNLTELIYKQGQAGVTRASVTLVLNNNDLAQSPPGYEAHKLIEITRQISRNGTTKYLINGSVAKLKTVKHLFRSMGLNIDNPTFLVMQGRITTILSMKPTEILGLIEECAGTTVYENNRNEAVKVFSAKETKLQEVSNTLDLDIFPRLQKLDAERQAALELSHLEEALKTFELVTSAQQLYSMATQITKLCKAIYSQQERIQQAVLESKQLEEQSRDALEVIRSLALETQSLETNAKLEKLSSEYSAARSAGDLFKERIAMIQTHETSLRKLLCDKENSRKTINNRISVVRQTLEKISIDPEIRSLSDQLGRLSSEKKLTEARLMLLTSGSLLKAKVKEDFSRFLTSPNTLFDGASDGPTLRTFQDGVLATISSGLQHSGSTVTCNEIWDHITATLRIKGQHMLSRFPDYATERIFSLKNTDALTPAEILSSLPLLFSELSAEAEPQLLSLVSAHLKMQTAGQDGLRIAIGTDEANLGTLGQSIADIVGDLGKISSGLEELLSLISPFANANQTSTADPVSADIHAEIHNTLFHPRNGMLSLDQYNEMQGLIKELSGILHFDHVASLSDMCSSASAFLDVLRAHIESGKDVVTDPINSSPLNYIGTFEASVKSLRKRLARFFDLLAQRSTRFSHYIDDVAAQINPDTYLNDLLRICPSNVSSSGVPYMIRNLSLETRTMYSLIGPTIGFFTLNTDRVKAYCAMLDNSLNERLYRQVIRILEMVSLPKLFHVVFLTAEKAMQFIKNPSVCTNRITAVPLDKVTKGELRNPQGVREALAKDKAFFLVDFFDSINSVVADYVFGKTVLCENTVVAKKISYSSSLGFRCITLDGDIVSPSGSVSGGARSFDLSTSANIFDAADVYRRKGGAHMLLTPMKSTRVEFVDQSAGALYFALTKTEELSMQQLKAIQEAITRVTDTAKMALYSAQKHENEMLSTIGSYSIQSIATDLPLTLANLLSDRALAYFPRPCQLTVLMELQKSHREYESSTMKIAEAVGKSILIDRFTAEMKTLTSDADTSEDPAALRKKLQEYTSQANSLEHRLSSLTSKYNKEKLELDLTSSEEDEQLLEKEVQKVQLELRKVTKDIASLAKDLERQNARTEALHSQLCEQNKYLEGLMNRKMDKETEYKQVQERLKEVDASIKNGTSSLIETKDAVLTACKEHDAFVNKLSGTLSAVCMILSQKDDYTRTIHQLRSFGAVSVEAKGSDKSRRSTAKSQSQAQGSVGDEMHIFLPERLLAILQQLEDGQSYAQFQAEYANIATTITRCARVVEILNESLRTTQPDAKDLMLLLLERQDIFEELQTRLKSAHSQLTITAGVSTNIQGTYEELRSSATELQQMRDKIMKDKEKILALISQIDDKKMIALQASYEQINSDLNKVFATLLPNSQASLKLVDSNDLSKGVIFDVTLGTTKTTISCLSGGQRSLLALSLIFSLLLCRPCPLYILDEIDAALDLNHTHNIGALIRSSFPHNQFIVISLKDGLFSNANVLFRVKFVGGLSTVERYVSNEKRT